MRRSFYEQLSGDLGHVHEARKLLEELGEAPVR